MTEEQYRENYQKFILWARDNPGQGYSLETDNGIFVDPITRWAALAYKAGLAEGRKENVE